MQFKYALMNWLNLVLVFAFICFISCSQLKSQTMQNSPYSSDITNREMIAAGRFYPADREQLLSSLKEMFDASKPGAPGKPRAIIVPHAGYPFSGNTAARGYNVLKGMHYDNIFLIGSSHRIYLKGASVYNAGHYKTPLGLASVNMKLGSELIENSPFFDFNEEAHVQEHSLEVQVPFLQHVFNTNELNLVPIIIGTQDKKTCRKLAEELKPWFTENNLFVISSDFSHYPDYESANKVDEITAKAIQTKSPRTFVGALTKNEQLNIPNLHTSACGWTSILTLLYLLEDKHELIIKHLEYTNSGDSKFGSKDQVVGYHAFAVVENNQPVKRKTKEQMISMEDKKKLVEIARSTIDTFLTRGKFPHISEDDLSPVLLKRCGAFVTLRINGELRGCIGRFGEEEILYKVVQDLAIAAATRDYRFPPLSPEEINEINIEISVLTPMRKISSISEIELGKHGIYIKKGNYRGTFLPKVALGTNWTLEEFLGYCSRDKAGLGWEGWKDADIYIYEAIDFNEKELLNTPKKKI